MDSDKPSNPSNKAGETDDLIEEMAKLMAKEPQQARPVASPVASKPVVPTPAAGAETSTPSGQSSFGNLERETPRTPNLERETPRTSNLERETPRTAPEPIAPPRADTSAGSSAGGSEGAPGWLPQPKRPEPEPSRSASQPVREEPTFGLRTEHKPSAPTPRPEPDAPTSRQEPSAPAPRQEPTVSAPRQEPDLRTTRQEPVEPARRQESIAPSPRQEFYLRTPVRPEPALPSSGTDAVQPPAHSNTPRAEPAPFDFGLSSRETARPAAASESHTESRPAFDFGFGPANSQHDESGQDPTPDQQGDVEPEIDPIADLIRTQFDRPEPQAEIAPEELRSETPSPRAAASDLDRQPPETSRQDHFDVSPVFGLGGEVPKRSTSGSDALDDIESLIGNAVRVDVSREAPAARPTEPSPRTEQLPPVMQPPVRPHQTPRRAPQPSQQPSGRVDPAEAAILAAMAAQDEPSAGAGDGRAAQATTYVTADSHGGSDEPLMTDGDVQSRRGLRPKAFIMPIVALVLLGALAYGGYLFLTSTPTEGDAPVLLADTDPSKVEPATETTTDSGQAVVFDGAGDGSDEQLVSRDQSQGSEDDAIRQIITADTTENGVANRKVRTVTVRPDGTIISGDDQVAGGEALSVDRPNVPALPEDAVTSDLANTDLSSVIADEGFDGPAATDPAVVSNPVTVDGVIVPYPAPLPANLSALRAAANSRPQTAAPVVTQPVVTPTPQPVAEEPGAVDLLGDAANAITPLVEVTPPQVTAVAQPPVQPPVSEVTAPAWVQLASQRDQGIATSEAGRLSRLYSSALGGRELTVRRADLGDRGIWYRVLVPATSLADAQRVCVQIQGIGGECFPRAN